MKRRVCLDLLTVHACEQRPPPPAWVAGMICTKCSPVQVVNDAIFDARSICMREYATAPEVVVYGDPDLTFAYVPSHLHHMVFELVKNSLKATNDKYEDADHDPPPVKVIVADGEEDIAVKVIWGEGREANSRPTAANLTSVNLTSMAAKNCRVERCMQQHCPAFLR